MRAVVVDRYGPPEVARGARGAHARRPGRARCSCGCIAAAVTSGDARMRSGTFPKGFALPGKLAMGIRGPRHRILGAVFSGEVAALGDGVTGFAVGDRVSGMTGMTVGGHAEFLATTRRRRSCRPPHPSRTTRPPRCCSAAPPPSTTCATRPQLKPGATVLVNGASGAVGSSAVQLARHLGAEVIGVTSAANAEFVTTLGASRVIDYRRTSLADLQARGERFDVVFDTVGNVSPASGRPLLTDGGVLLLAVAGLGELLAARGNVKAGPASEDPANVATVLQLTADGVLDPLIESAHPLDGIVDAYRRIDSGRKVGNIVVRPGERG